MNTRMALLRHAERQLIPSALHEELVVPACIGQLYALLCNPRLQLQHHSHAFQSTSMPIAATHL